MSLINDALRRANQGKKDPSSAASGGGPMQPVPPHAHSGKPSYGPMLMVLIAVMLLAAGWFFWKGSQPHSKATETVGTGSRPTSPETTANRSAIDTKIAPSIIAPPVSPLPASKTPAVPASAKVEPPPTEILSNVAVSPVASEPTPSTNAVAVPTPPAPPALKLQGIFYRLRNPTAMINGKTVGVGDFVSGARVLKIGRQEVVLERDGQTKTLTME